MKLVTTKFKSGGIHEKHIVATWNLGNHLSICFWAQGNQEKPVSTWENLCRDGKTCVEMVKPVSRSLLCMLVQFVTGLFLLLSFSHVVHLYQLLDDVFYILVVFF